MFSFKKRHVPTYLSYCPLLPFFWPSRRRKSYFHQVKAMRHETDGGLNNATRYRRSCSDTKKWPLPHPKTENKTGFPFIVLKPASSAVGSDGSFLFTAYTRKNVLFAHSTSPLPRVLASQDTGHHQTWRAYAPLS